MALINSVGQKNLAQLHVYMNGRDCKRPHARSLATQVVCEYAVLDHTRARPMDGSGQCGKW